MGLKIVAWDREKMKMDNPGSMYLGFQSESDITFDLGEERVPEMGTLDLL